MNLHAHTTRTHTIFQRFADERGVCYIALISLRYRIDPFWLMTQQDVQLEKSLWHPEGKESKSRRILVQIDYTTKFIEPRF